MSDPETARENLRDFEKMWKRGRPSGPRLGSPSTTKLDDVISQLFTYLNMRRESAPNIYFETALGSGLVPIRFGVPSVGPPKPDLETRVERIEEKLEKLQVEFGQLDAIAKKIVLDEFSSLSYVKRILMERSREGVSIYLVCQSADLRTVLQDVFVRKKAIRDKYPTLYLDVIPITEQSMPQSGFYQAIQIFNRV